MPRYRSSDKHTPTAPYPAEQWPPKLGEELSIMKQLMLVLFPLQKNRLEQRGSER